MKLKKAHIQNFRRLEDIFFELDSHETLFVGPNNSGKTSAASAFRCFIGNRKFLIHDFTLLALATIGEWPPDAKDSDGNHIEVL